MDVLVDAGELVRVGRVHVGGGEAEGVAAARVVREPHRKRARILHDVHFVLPVPHDGRGAPSKRVGCVVGGEPCRGAHEAAVPAHVLAQARSWCDQVVHGAY